MTPEGTEKGLRAAGARALAALTGDKKEEPEKVPSTATEHAAALEKHEKETSDALNAVISQPEEPTPEEAEKIRDAKKARISQIMSGGILNERLQAICNNSVPEGYKGKFVKDSEDFIIRYGNLGFVFHYAEGAVGLHDTSDGRIRAGDLVLMTIPAEDHSILDEVRTEKVKQKLSAGRDEYHRQMQNSGQEAGILDTSDTVISK